MDPLPIEAVLEPILDALARAGAVVVEAPPGAGKTTRVPWAIAERTRARAENSGGTGRFEVWVTEPRRVAARLAATRVAAERGCRVGEAVGYTVRFDDRSSRATRVRYVTEGVLARRLATDPRLESIGAVVLDEMHERNLAGDRCLALLDRLRRTERPDLELAVMSATLDAEPIARFLGDCPRIVSEGKRYPVEVEYLRAPDERPLVQQVSAAVKLLVRERGEGHVLAFLPGAGEIRRCLELLAPWGAEQGLAVVPLHGDLPLAEQTRAIEPSERRKIVLSTNVAESSVTVAGVAAVVDSGLARIARESPWTGLSRLRLEKISQASATQRAGRAGRTGPGRVLRLYTRADFETRPPFDEPEVRRADLAETALELRALGIADPTSLRWLDTPPSPAIARALALLADLGAFDAHGGLSEIGRRLLTLPLHPRLGRVLVEAGQRGIARLGCRAVALLSERDIRLDARTRFDGAREHADVTRGSSDVVELCDRLDEAETLNGDPRRLRAAELDPGATMNVLGTERALARRLEPSETAAHEPADPETELEISLLAGFFDRLAKRRKPGGSELVLANGRTATLSERSVVRDAPLLLALEVDDTAARPGTSPRVRLASQVRAEWLLDYYAERLTSRDEILWNQEYERAERVSALACGSIVLEESRGVAEPSPETRRLVVKAALAKGAAYFDPEGRAGELAVRLELLRRHLPELDWPDLSAGAFATAIDLAAETSVSLERLRGTDLKEMLSAALGPRERAALFEHTPEKVALPGGRAVRVHYPPGQPPCIESRLQDFFSLGQTPSILRGTVPLTVHLLAPNKRAVQVTQDLAGFWANHYPKLRKELMRRYPKHAWPEDGRTAVPPRGSSQR